MNDLDTELEQISAGDAEAFGRWMARAELPVRQSLRPFAAFVDAEAVVQEAFLRIWQVAPRFKRDGRPNGLLRLSITTARNLAVSELRRGRPSQEQRDALERALAEGADAGAALPDPLLREAILACREKLPGKPRLALDARISGEGGRPDVDLAQALGMTLNTFLQNFTRARKLLADCLRGRGISLDGELR